MQIKTVIWCHYPPIIKVKIQKELRPIAGYTVEQGELSFFAVELQNCATTLEDSLTFPHKAKCNLVTQFSNSAPRYLSKWSETYLHIKSCMKMFMDALFIRAKAWKQPRCPS